MPITRAGCKIRDIFRHGHSPLLCAERRLVESERDTLLRLVRSFWVEGQLRREREVTVGMEW